MSELPEVLREPITTPEGVWHFFREVAPWQQIRWGTERVVRLLELLGHPEQKSKFVIVGGTNAKGSTTLYLASLMNTLGLPTGATLSPHVSDLTERIHLGGQFIPVDLLIGTCERLRMARLGWPSGEDSTPTYHELWTAAAVDAFATAAMEWGIVEVGMGGRYDAARAVPAEVAVITPISFDHMQFLGDTITAIAMEKVEIVEPGALLISAPQSHEADAVLGAKTQIVGATWLPLDREVDLTLDPESGALQPRFSYRRGELFLPELQAGLRGRYQVTNAAVALLSIQGMHERGLIPRLPTPDEAQAALLAVTPAHHPARFEQLSLVPPLWCEGGHNPAALEAFVADFAQIRGDGPLELFVGFKWDKDVEQALRTLALLQPAGVTITESHQMQPRPAAEVAEIARKLLPETKIMPISEMHAAAQTWLERVRATPGATGLAIGSLYLCGDLRRLIASGGLGDGPWLVPPMQLPEAN